MNYALFMKSLLGKEAFEDFVKLLNVIYSPAQR
jgi:hypothetical protein